jgi:hypothetical protein
MKYEALAPVMDERMTRLWAAAEASSLGPGGAAAVTRATGIRGKRIWMGRKDLDELSKNPPVEPPRRQRVRRPGAGRKLLTVTDPTLAKDLESLIDPVTRGDPESLQRLSGGVGARNTVGVMDDAIDECRGTGGVGEDGGPVAKSEIGREDGTFLLVSTADDLEEEVGVSVVEGEEADLVQDQ